MLLFWGMWKNSYPRNIITTCRRTLMIYCAWRISVMANISLWSVRSTTSVIHALKYEQSCFIDWVNTEPKIIIIEHFSMQWSNTLSSWNTQFFQLLFRGFDKVSYYSSPPTILSSCCSAECFSKMIYYSLKRIK